MEPIGTITMCFPHIDEETRSILQSLMNDAENFADFTECLCDRVCAEASSPLLEYFAVYFAFSMDYYILLDRLDSAGKVSDLASPLLLIAKVRRGEDVSWDDLRKSVKLALMAAPNDWIACHLYLNWRVIADLCYPECDVDIRPIEAIASSVEKNTDLTYFKTILLTIKARGHMRESKYKEAVDQLKQALTIARKFDDQCLVADLLGNIAGYIKQTDVKQAIDLLVSSRELSERLGLQAHIGLLLNSLGHIMQFRGELDAAIEYQLDCKTIRESFGLPQPIMNSIIASLYNQFGKGEEAFQQAKTALDLRSSAVRIFPLPHAQMAWALINLGRYDDAEAELATTHELATKSGSLEDMIWAQLVEGLLDKAERNFDSANLIFKEVLDGSEDNPILLFQNICLLNLTEIEIEMLTDEFLKKNSDLSGFWMEKLVEHAEKNDLPGIAARALLLKAELRRRQGRVDEVRKILKEVQKTAKAPSMKYLNDLAISMFPDIIMT
jgi:tetratricopeptide (TPR) repeat protein